MKKNLDIWNFVVRVYRKENVASACLNLQKRHNTDIPMLLSVAFGVLNKKSFSHGDLRRLKSKTNLWHNEIVTKLRFVRQKLKIGPQPAPDVLTEALRTKIKATELEAEKIQIQFLGAQLSSLPESIEECSLTKIQDVLIQVVSLYTDHPLKTNDKKDIFSIASAILGKN